MRSARTIALAVSMALVVPPVVTAFPTTAFAQKSKPVREQLPLEARGHWDAGVAFAQKGSSWDAARSSFKAAYELSKNPRVLYNVGICEKELQHFAAALDTFKRELAEGKDLSAADRAEVQQNIEDLKKLVGHLTIEVSEKDADVYIDGEKIDAAKLAGPITVDLGTRQLRATKSGFSDAQAAVSLNGGASETAKLVLRQFVPTSLVNVTVVGPTNAVVRIDGNERGSAASGKPWQGQLTVQKEPHQISAEAPGYVTATQPVSVLKEGETTNVTLQLAMDQEKGKLIVVTKTEGAAIEIDGKVVGASRWEGPVDARTHQITVKKTGYYPFTYDVDVPRGGERSVTANLNEDRNSSFVPWLVGTIVVGAAITVGIVLLATPPDEKPTRGTLAPFSLGTQSGAGFRF